jgi:peptidoglycan/LPS O-acetylase OafA/YrhL
MFEWLTRAALRRDAPRQPGSPPAGPDRFPLFDSLRAVAAISIVLCHLTGVTSFSPIHSWVVNLRAGVTVFFLISGFLLYRPFAKAHLRGESRLDLGAYAWRRVLRIVPAYWVALTLISIWLGRDTVLSAHGTTYLLFGQIYRPTLLLGGLGQAWSLCVEITFYAFLPLWAAFMARGRLTDRHARLRREWLGVLGLVIVSLLYKEALVFPHPQSPLQAALPRYLDLFGLGMGLALLSLMYEGRELPRALRPLDRFPSLGWLFALPFFVLVGAIHAKTGDLTVPVFVEHYLYAVVGVGLLAPAVFGRQDRGLLRRFLANRIMVWLGLISYAIFLWHLAVIVQLARWGTPISLSHSTGVPVTVVWIVLVFPPTFLISWLSWVLVERPSLRLKRDIPWRGGRARREEAWIVGGSALLLLVLVLAGGPFGALEWILAVGALATLACLTTPVRRLLAKRRLRPAWLMAALGIVVGAVAIARYSSTVSATRPPEIPALVAATHDGRTLRLYLNGNQVAATAAPGAPDRGKGFFTIGGALGNAAGWAGTVDEVAIYRRVLAPAQLQAQSASGAGYGHGPYTATVRAPGGLLDYWRLDDPKGANAANSAGQTKGIYGDQVTQRAPGLIRGDRDTAVRFEGFGSDVIFQPPPGAQLAHGMTLEAWATTSLGGGRALVGKAASYAITTNRGGHWQANVVIHQHIYTATAPERVIGSASALRPTEALLVVLAALGVLVGGLTHVMQGGPPGRRRLRRRGPRRRPSGRRPLPHPLVEEGDARDLEEVARGEG